MFEMLNGIGLLAAGTVPTEVQNGLDNVSAIVSAVVPVAVALVVTFIGIRLLRRVK